MSIRKFGAVALAAVALVAVRASMWAVDSTDCDESGVPALFFIGIGALAVFAAVGVAGARLRWAIVAAIPYAAVVFAIDGAVSIGNCTS